MIYTLTLNPAIDYIMHIDKLNSGTIMKSFSESIQFGGKGINASVMLSTLGQRSVATGFVAGFTGQALSEAIQDGRTTSDFIVLKEGMTRINVKLRHTAETDINSGGPHVSKSDVQALFTKLDALCEGDVLILSGSIPRGLDCNIYSDIMQRLSARGVKFAVDAEKDLLLNTLKHKPFVIKPNNHEVSEIFGASVDSPEIALVYAKKLQQMGALNVLISLGSMGAVLLDEKGISHCKKAHNGTVINTVGAGDSMLAGFIAGYIDTQNYDYALKLGTACGGATAFSEGLAKYADIQKLLDL